MKSPQILLDISLTSKHFQLHTRLDHFSVRMGINGWCSHFHKPHLLYKGTLSTVTFLITTQRWLQKPRKDDSVSVLHLLICTCQTTFSEISSADYCRIKHVTAANFKIPSFFKGLGRFSGYLWDIFSKIVLLEVIL